MDITEKYYKEIAYLESLGNIAHMPNYQNKYTNPKIFIKRLKYILKLLKNPQNKIKNYIHIGGTSGKGSVANFVHNILVCADKKSFLFTSPFTTETIEKYKINDKFISAKEFIGIINKIKPAIDECIEKSPYGTPSYFEVCFIIAIFASINNKCDYFVSEVGLGGEFDATNIVPKKKIVIITHIDYDHTNILGKNLKQIATTKSKIITKNSIFFTGESRSSLRAIFKKECQKHTARYNYVRKTYSRLVFKNNRYSFDYKNNSYMLSMWGQHQVENAILAIEACNALGIKNATIATGLKKTRLPGRFEIVANRPKIVLDVAHNPDKIKSTIDNLGLLDFDKLYVIYASAEDKDTKNIAGLLAKYIDGITITKFFNPYRICANPKTLAKYFQKENKKIHVNLTLDPWQALETNIKKAKKNDLVLICGSFFLVGELRKNWRDSKTILRTRKII